MNQYAYRSLGPGEKRVRLIQLLPGRDTADVRCQIFHHTIRAERSFSPYEALSYCWGDLNDAHQIHVKDQTSDEFHTLDVTVNLFAALRRLRDPNLPRILWVDAICIDQDNLTERAQQVQFMGTIFACASQVIVWLGEAEEPGHYEAFEILRDISYQPTTVSRDGPTILRDLLRRKWFTRVWVLQEITAARALSIMYGDDEISGSAFVYGMQRLSPAFVQLDPHLRAFIPAIMDLMAYVPPAPSARAFTQTLDVGPLGEVIEMFHQNGATDQRDKVYALLNMRCDRHPTHVLQPDYEISWKKLFSDLIEHLLGDLAVATTWEERDCAVIATTGCPIGYVARVEGNTIQVKSKKSGREDADVLGEPAWIAQWKIRPFCKQVLREDIVCLLTGARYPSIIRPCGDHFDIIVLAIGSMPQVDYGFDKPENIGFPWLTTTFLRDWYIRQPRQLHNFLLIWDWGQVTPDTPMHHIDLMFGESQWSFTHGNENVPDPSKSMSRMLLVRRVLHDVWHEEHVRFQNFQNPYAHVLENYEDEDKLDNRFRSYSMVSFPLVAELDLHFESHLHAKFEFFESPDNRYRYRWLRSYAEELRYCIRLLQCDLAPGHPGSLRKFRSSDAILQHWASQRRFDYGFFGLIDMDDSKETSSWLDARTSSNRRLGSDYLPMHYEFGETRHHDILQELFPSYKSAANPLGDHCGQMSYIISPFNGRYLINVLLSQESFDKALIQRLVRYILIKPLGQTDRNVRLLAILSEACNNQLPVDLDLIDNLKLDAAGSAILAFIFNELWYDKDIVRHILARVIDYRGVEFYFFKKHGRNIVAHLDRLATQDQSVVDNDAIFSNLCKQKYKTSHRRHLLRLLDVSGRKDLLRHVRNWVIDLMPLHLSEREYRDKLPDVVDRSAANTDDGL